MAYYEFPHTENYDEDLGWLIEKYGDIIEAIEDHETRIKYLEEHGGGGGGKDYSKEITELQTGLANLKTTVTSNKTATDKEIKTLTSAITALQTRATSLENRMTTVESRITTAEGNITTVKNTAETAKKTAETAKTTAEAIATTAETAKTTAETASATATEAKTTAETAKTTAETAQSTADANTEAIRQLSFIGKETVSTLADLPRPGEENKIYYVTDIKGYYIYNGEAYRSIDATAALTLLDAKQDTLISGTNIKTVNGNSLLGSGNVEISGGGGTVINYGSSLPEAGADYANQLFIVQVGFADKVTLYKCIAYTQATTTYYKWALVTSTSLDGLTFSSLTAQNSDQKPEGAGVTISADYTSGISGINFRNTADSTEPKLTTSAWLDSTTQDSPLIKMYINSELPSDADQIKESLDPYTNTIYFNTTTGHYYLYDKTNAIWYRIDAIKDGLMDVTGTTDEYIYLGSNKRVTIRNTSSWTTLSANSFSGTEFNGTRASLTSHVTVGGNLTVNGNLNAKSILATSTIPTSPTKYRFYNFGDDKLWYHNGSQWCYIESTAGTPTVTTSSDVSANETELNDINEAGEKIANEIDAAKTGVKTDDPLIN